MVAVLIVSTLYLCFCVLVLFIRTQDLNKRLSKLEGLGRESA